MNLQDLSAMYDPETMDFDEFVRQYNPDSTQNLRTQQDLEYEQSLAQDQAKEKLKVQPVQKEDDPKPTLEYDEDPKPTLEELRRLRIAKLSGETPLPKVTIPDYTKCTVVELKKQCKERGLKGFTGKCKQELIDLLK